MHTLFNPLLLAVLIASAPSSCTQEKEKPQPQPQPKPAPNVDQKADSKFIRFVDLGKGEGKLETAVITYEGPGGVKVDLISAVHVADGSYYQKVQELSRGYDSFLYEMVKPRGMKPGRPRPKRPERPERPAAASQSLVSRFQRLLKDTLELEFQLDFVDYSQKNFVHADLDSETFSKLREEKGESVAKLIIRAMLQGMQRQQKGKDQGADGLKLLAALFLPDRARALKYLLAKQLQDVEELIAGMDVGRDGKGSVVLSERNKQVMRVIHRQLKKGDKKLGVFFGGGHMQDIEKRIFRQLGFRRTKVRWLLAWDVRKSG